MCTHRVQKQYWLVWFFNVCREQLLCQCILFILHLFWTLFEYLTMDELYFENNDVSLVDGEYNSRYIDIPHTVCKMVLGMSRENIRVPFPYCVIAVIWQKLNSPYFVGFKHPQI